MIKKETIKTYVCDICSEVIDKNDLKPIGDYHHFHQDCYDNLNRYIKANIEDILSAVHRHEIRNALDPGVGYYLLWAGEEAELHKMIYKRQAEELILQMDEEFGDDTHLSLVLYQGALKNATIQKTVVWSD